MQSGKLNFKHFSIIKKNQISNISHYQRIFMVAQAKQKCVNKLLKHLCISPESQIIVEKSPEKIVFLYFNI